MPAAPVPDRPPFSLSFHRMNLRSPHPTANGIRGGLCRIQECASGLELTAVPLQAQVLRRAPPRLPGNASAGQQPALMEQRRIAHPLSVDMHLERPDQWRPASRRKGSAPYRWRGNLSDPLSRFPAIWDSISRTAVMSDRPAPGERHARRSIRTAGRESLPPGALALYDASRPSALIMPEAYRAKVLVITRRALGLSESRAAPPLSRAPSRPIRHCRPCCCPYFRPRADGAGPHRGRSGGRSPTPCWICSRSRRAPSTPSARSARATWRTGAPVRTARIWPAFTRSSTNTWRIPGFHRKRSRGITESPCAICHKLFQEHSTRSARWIRQRRLEECRKELARGGR